jgi:UDP-N-acetylmuramate dehydrogenase
LRSGQEVTLTKDDLQFDYRSSNLPESAVIIEVTLEAPRGVPEELHAKMAAQLAKRDETQPTKDRTAGSTFRNPAGFSSTGRADDVHDLKAWKLIDDAGLRGKMLGKAQMSEKHPNFLINTGGATAAELEDLGELVRKEVLKSAGIELQWEVLRVGKRSTES